MKLISAMFFYHPHVRSLLYFCDSQRQRLLSHFCAWLTKRCRGELQPPKLRQKVYQVLVSPDFTG